ncbi:hypothetical protein C0Q70_14541 [Pomacea canaliculata]|uniref:Peptidase S1 domain-containing protein n=1 Tax=Pomacea canaliculata TaxID=400727 RepID=A0A2T7NSB8_POMCA|nr:hypothetical protein C0Q70_14541 [Pomacea canaliculata]
MATRLTSLAGPGILFVLLLLPGHKCLGGAQKECGRSTERAASPDKRIVGGTEADESRFPWQVRLRSLAATMCGGVLIDSFWVLTAASCFTRNYSPVNWNIGLAAVRVEGDSVEDFQLDREERQSVHVDSLYIYGGHQLNSSRHDLALVHLHSDNLTRQREPACVIAETDDVNNKTCLVVGWGEPPSPTLRKLLTPVSDYVHCNQRHNASVGPDSLCAELPDDTIGPCTMKAGAYGFHSSSRTVCGRGSEEDRDQRSRLPFTFQHGLL